MRKLSASLLLVLLMSTAGYAQSLPPATAVVERPGAAPDVADVTQRALQARKIGDRKFWAVAAALNTAMILDTKSTFDVSKRCPECYEANPFVAPFVNRGAPLTFAAGEAFDAGVMTLAAKMKTCERTWIRRTWWIVPAALMTGHALAWRHNANLAR